MGASKIAVKIELENQKLFVFFVEKVRVAEDMQTRYSLCGTRLVPKQFLMFANKDHNGQPNENH